MTEGVSRLLISSVKIKTDGLGVVSFLGSARGETEHQEPWLPMEELKLKLQSVKQHSDSSYTI
jgi:hypothetical protein